MIAIDANFSMSNWDRMCEFIRETYNPNHAILNKQLFKWLFCTNPDENIANLVVAYDDGELISLLGYIPTRFRFYDTVENGVWMANWMTKEKYRRGIGALLMKKMTEMFPVVAGQGATEINKQIVLKMGMHFRDRIPKVVFMIDEKMSTSLFGHTFESASTKTPQNLSGICIDDCLIHNGNLPEFCPTTKLYPTLAFGTLRDSDYIRHRFVEFPFFDYKVFFRGTFDRPVILVARIIDASMPQPDGRIFKIARILEFFYPEDSDGRTSAAEILDTAKQFFFEQNCIYADFFCSGSEHIRFLFAQGFHSDDEGLLPNYLSPVDFKLRFQNLELQVSKELLKKFPEALSKFYITRSDGDQDRPNQNIQILHEK